MGRRARPRLCHSGWADSGGGGCCGGGALVLAGANRHGLAAQGKPTFKGTRIMLWQLFEHLALAESLADIFPGG